MDRNIEKLWLELDNITFNEDKNSDDSSYMILAEDFKHWKAGTTRDDIWRWFDIKHSKGVGYLINEFEK
jgi:hypothetical protein